MTALRSLFYETMRPQIRWEGDARVPASPDKIAVVAQYSITPRVSRSLTALVQEVAEAGYFVLLVSACPVDAPLEWPAGIDLERVAVLRKPNIGYDFGSWAVGIQHVPQVLKARLLLQINDSLVGPLWSLERVLNDFEQTPHDWWGMVRSHQFAPHMQSYFLGFKSQVLQSQPFQDFWARVSVHADKHEIINRYEVGFQRRLYNEGFTSGCFLDSREIVATGDNPMIQGWQQTLEAGVPFVKRELLLNPNLIPGADRVPQVLEAEYDVHWRQWLP